MHKQFRSILFARLISRKRNLSLNFLAMQKWEIVRSSSNFKFHETKFLECFVNLLSISRFHLKHKNHTIMFSFYIKTNSKLKTPVK